NPFILYFAQCFHISRNIYHSSAKLTGRTFSRSFSYILKMHIEDSIFISNDIFNRILLIARMMPHIKADAYTAVKIFDIIMNYRRIWIYFVFRAMIVNGVSYIVFLTFF